MEAEAVRTAYLALGSNLGDKRGNLITAVRMLDESPGCRVIAASSLYRTAPVGYEHQPDFINAVVAVETAFSPRRLLKLCLEIEETMGRRRTIRWGPRVIDIDILLYDDVTVAEDDLVVPHPRMLDRAFVLAPLAEIAPDVLVGPSQTAREAAERVGVKGIERLDEEWWSA